jgi:hypothetical protein
VFANPFGEEDPFRYEHEGNNLTEKAG